MAKIKKFLKALIPPIIVSLFKKLTTKQIEIEDLNIWSGDYRFWPEAKAQCSGYDSNTILEQCKAAMLKVKNGEAIYERDSVLFDEIQYSWGLLAGLQRVALENDGKLCVLDFGGSLGSSYYQNKAFLNTLKELQWCVVEQRNFVDCGKEYFENEQLIFYYTIEECMLNCKPNVLLLSSVLQYLEKPYDWLNKFVSFKIPYIIIDRTAFIDYDKDILTVQNVPKSIYKSSYPAWFFNIENFKKQFRNYEIIASFNAHEGYVIHLENGSTASYKGFILKYNFDS